MPNHPTITRCRVAPEKDKNHRLLRHGERVLPGDEVWGWGRGPWSESSIVGGIFDAYSNWPIRRKLEPGERALSNLK